MNSLPHVSAIVVNWNGADHLTVELPSLVNQTYPSFDIIVVDNGSVDASEQVVRQFGAGWLPLYRNIGLAAAMNEGVRAAKGEFLVFLNNDMRFEPQFIELLTEALASNESAFAAGARQLDWEGRRVVHSRTFLRPGSWLSSPIPGWDFGQQEVTSISNCLFVSAANLMVRRVQFEELGGWDASFPIGYEDVDLCWRAWIRGWRTIFVPDAVCYHKVGATSERAEGRSARYRGTLGGRLLFATKHLPAKPAIFAWLLAVGGIARDLARADFHAVWVRARVIAEFLARAPRAIRSRRSLYFGRGITPKQHLRGLQRLDA